MSTKPPASGPGALGRAIDPDHPGTRGNYRMLKTPPDEPIVQIQRVGHESRVHLDIETDDIPAEVARLEKLGACVVDRLERWVVMQAPTGSGSASCVSSGPVFQRTRTGGTSGYPCAAARRVIPALQSGFTRYVHNPRVSAASLEKP